MAPLKAATSHLHLSDFTLPSRLSHSGVLLDVSTLHKLCLSFGSPHRSVQPQKQ